MDDRLPDGPYFRISLHGKDEAHPSLLSVATFLLDFTTLYELIRLAAESEERFHRLARSRYALYRNARRVQYEQKLFLERLRHESPLELAALFTAYGAGGIGAAWGLVQVVDKIWNMPLARRKLAAEVEKLERENERTRRPGRKLLLCKCQAIRLLPFKHSTKRVLSIPLSGVLKGPKSQLPKRTSTW